VEVGATLSHNDNLEVQIGEGDVILFSKAKNPTTASEEPNCLSRVYKVARKKQHLEVTFRAVPGAKFTSSLSPGSIIRGAKIQSITTLEREYGALAALQYYDLCEYILKAEPSQLLKYSDKQLENYINTYCLNKAQAKAVKSALDNDAFTLIQGYIHSQFLFSNHYR
jgi:senataxin